MSSPYALKREKAAWRESVAAVESAILRVGANLDPQPVAGTVGARAPLRYDRQPRVRAWAPGPARIIDPARRRLPHRPAP